MRLNLAEKLRGERMEVVVYALKNGLGIFKSENGGHFWTYLQGSPDYTYTLAMSPLRWINENSRIPLKMFLL